MKRAIILIFSAFIILSNSIAQTNTFSGFVKDADSKEPLIGANVYLKGTYKGVTTNDYGYFSLSIPEKNKNCDIDISFIGYSSLTLKSDLQKNGWVYYLKQGLSIQEVSITTKRKIEDAPDMSMLHISMREIRVMPQLFQQDLIKSIQLMPGIQGGREGSAGMFVRGGSTDQNLVLLDDVPIYYVNHAGNMVSTFDNNTIKEFKLYKGAFPARYGGRLSSVLDIRMKEGDKSNYHGEIGLGLLSGNAFIEGPIVKDKASFFISYRKFWPGYVLKAITKNRFSYGFDDFSAKISADITNKDKLMLSFYTGNDVLINKIKSSRDENSYGQSKVNWSNILGAVKYTRVITENLFADLTTYYTQYKYNTNNDAYYFEEDSTTSHYYTHYSSFVGDLSAKLSFDYSPANFFKLKFGGQYINHHYLPGASSFSNTGSVIYSDTANFNNIYASEPSIFIESDYNLSKNVSVNFGVRNSYFISTQNNYYSIEPRIMLRYNIEDICAIKASYGQMMQTIHMLSYSSSGMANDLWLPPTSNLKPAKSKQGDLGIYKTLKEGMYELSIEAYYKYMQNLIAYKNGESFFSGSGNWDDKLETDGIGISKGIEIMVQKKEGKLTGWVGYTLAKADRMFENKNNGQMYPFKYDRRHDFSIVSNYWLNKKITFSATWVYGTGYPITFTTVKYYVKNNNPHYKNETNDLYSGLFEVCNYKGTNAFRMRCYHRMDLAMTYRKHKQKTERIWNFSIYNIYNRQNPLFYSYIIENNDKISLVQQSMFPIMPSVSYTVKF